MPRATKRTRKPPAQPASSRVPAAPTEYHVKIHEAKTTLSSLIRMVEQGSRVVIARGDTPIAELVPVRTAAATGRPRQFGALRGVVSVGPAFFEPLPAAELAAWE